MSGNGVVSIFAPRGRGRILGGYSGPVSKDYNVFKGGAEAVGVILGHGFIGLDDCGEVWWAW